MTADVVTIKPALALGSWTAFKETNSGHAMAMGDLVLLESKGTPVIDALQRGGIEQRLRQIRLDLPTAELDRILKVNGKIAGGTYQFAVPRAEKISENGMEVPPSMGMATALNFQPTGNGRAAITGDFVMIGSEVNPVICVLRGGGIAVTALHSHMLDETPRLFFMRFWANEDAVKLAMTLRRALDQMNVKK